MRNLLKNRKNDPLLNELSHIINDRRSYAFQFQKYVYNNVQKSTLNELISQCLSHYMSQLDQFLVIIFIVFIGLVIINFAVYFVGLVFVVTVSISHQLLQHNIRRYIGRLSIPLFIQQVINNHKHRILYNIINISQLIIKSNQIIIFFSLLSMKICKFFIFCLYLLSSFVNSLYDVPSYYGHHSKSFFLPESIIANSKKLTYFEFHYGIDFDYDNSSIYFANRLQHCIEKYDPHDNKIHIVAGRCGASGNRIGQIDLTLFNEPSSIVYYQARDSFDASKSEAKIVNDSQCDTRDSGCILSVYPPQLNVSNIRIEPKLVQFPRINKSQQQFLYVSDRLNHCIKRIRLKDHLVDLVAGQCGQSGFLDGPLGYNKLNRPSNLGIDNKGTIYFFDEGNEYMRKIVNGSVYTLLNGACTQYNLSRKKYGYSIYNILCYEGWVQEKTTAITQHFFDSSTLEFCIDHISNCQ